MMTKNHERTLTTYSIFYNYVRVQPNLTLGMTMEVAFTKG